MNKSIVRIVSANGTYEDKMVDDSEIVERLLNGASLRTFMIPDSSIPSNYPEHIETYDLPHVIINGEYFWGKSETAHLMKKTLSVESFCYTNIGNIFCSFHSASNRVNLMSKKRYKRHNWFLKENYRLVWDSAIDTSAEGIKKGIESCSKFRVAMLDSEDIWNIHPVDLPMYYTGKKGFELKTVADFYPMFFRCPSDIEKVISDNRDFFNSDCVDASKVMRAEVQGFSSFYMIRSDGVYYNFYDIPRNTTQNYKRLKIFVDRLNR